MNPTTSSWAGVAAGQREEMQRALTISTAGSILVQAFINRVVQALTLRWLGVQSQLDRRPGQGPAAYINRRSVGTTYGEWLADTSEPTEDTGTYTQVSFQYRTLVTRGKITRRLQATGRTYADTMALELQARVDDISAVFEDGLVIGNNAASSNQINGLLTMINAVSGQVVGNTTAAVGDGLRLSKLDEAIDKVKGNDSDKLIFTSLKGNRLINAALQAQQRFNDVTVVRAGFRVGTYQDIPIIKSTGFPDTLVWSGSATSITAFTGGTSTAIAIVNRSMIWIEDLVPLTVYPLARASSQYDSFDLALDTVLVHANTLGGVILGGLA
jgi:hypothetical protein